MEFKVSETRTANSICEKVCRILNSKNIYDFSQDIINSLFNTESNIDYSIYPEVARMIIPAFEELKKGKVVVNTGNNKVGIIHSVGFSNRDAKSIHFGVIVIDVNEVYNTTWALNTIEDTSLDAFQYLSSIRLFTL